MGITKIVTLSKEPVLCDDCDTEFIPHCRAALDSYYTCGCGGALCVNCHTNAEEAQAEQAFHAFHSG